MWPGAKTWTARAMVALTLLGCVLFPALPTLCAVKIGLTGWTVLRPSRGGLAAR